METTSDILSDSDSAIHSSKVTRSASCTNKSDGLSVPMSFSQSIFSPPLTATQSCPPVMDDGMESFDLAVTDDHAVSDPELDLDISGHLAPAAASIQLKTCVTSAKRPLAECEESSQKKRTERV